MRRLLTYAACDSFVGPPIAGKQWHGRIEGWVDGDKLPESIWTKKRVYLPPGTPLYPGIYALCTSYGGTCSHRVWPLQIVGVPL